MKARFSPSCYRSCVKMGASQRNLSKNKLGDCLLLLLNSVIAKYCDLSDQLFAFGFGK